MLLSLLGYFALGLLLAIPLARLLRWLAVRWGLYNPAWRYLQPYRPVPAAASTRAPSPPTRE
jgi:hypothetical protein